MKTEAIKKAYIVRYGEIALKGKNRKSFEERLIHALYAYAQAQNKTIEKIIRPRGRIIIFTDDELDLSTIYGIVSYSPAYVFSFPEALKEEKAAAQTWLLSSLEPYLNRVKSPFRVSAQRITKTFPLNSLEMNRVVGGFVKKHTQSTVDLTNPKTEIILEIIQDKIFLSFQKYQGPGGLPVGIEGKALLVVKNSLAGKAGILALKRGVSVYPVFSSSSVLEEKKLLQELQPYCYGYQLKSFTVPDFKETTLAELAAKEKISAVVLPDTFDAFSEEYHAFLCLRPLLGDVSLAHQ